MKMADKMLKKREARDAFKEPWQCDAQPDGEMSQEEPRDPDDIKPDEKMSQEELRRCRYIRALQSQRVTVHVGPTGKPFHVPEDLLIAHSRSQIFEKRKIKSFQGSIPRWHGFHEVKVSTFENFFVWLHTLEPNINSKSFDEILDLAIFAERYQISHLRNQTSDILRERFYHEDWKPTPEQVAIVYDLTKSGAFIRQLCSWAIAIKFRAQPDPNRWLDFWTDSTTESDNCVSWERAFRSYADLGWDYFTYSQTEQSKVANMMSQGPCRFHDHSDIPNRKPNLRPPSPTDVCPYLHGAPVTMTEAESATEDQLVEEPAVNVAPVDDDNNPETEQAISVVEPQPEPEEIPPPEPIVEAGPSNDHDELPVAGKKVALDADTILEAFFPRKPKKKGKVVTFEEPAESEVIFTPETSDASDQAHEPELSPSTPDNDLGRGSSKQKYAGPLFGEVPNIEEAKAKIRDEWGTWGATLSNRDKKGKAKNVVEAPPPAPIPSSAAMDLTEPEADIWSFGSTTKRMEVIEARLEHAEPPESTKIPEVPTALDAIPSDHNVFFDFSEKNKKKGLAWAVEEESTAKEAVSPEEGMFTFGLSKKKDKKKKEIVFWAEDEVPEEPKEELSIVEEPAVVEGLAKLEVPTAEETTLPGGEMFNFGHSKKDKKKRLASWTEEHMPVGAVEEYSKPDVPAAEEALHSEEDFGWRRSKKDKKKKKVIIAWGQEEVPAEPVEELAAVEEPVAVEEPAAELDRWDSFMPAKYKKKKKGLVAWPQEEAPEIPAAPMEDSKPVEDAFASWVPAVSKKDKKKGSETWPENDVPVEPVEEPAPIKEEALWASAWDGHSTSKKDKKKKKGLTDWPRDEVPEVPAAPMEDPKPVEDDFDIMNFVAKSQKNKMKRAKYAEKVDEVPD